VDTPRGFYPGHRTLPGAAAFWVLAVLFLMLFFASAAASPLYPVYQAQFRFSAATLTAVFAVYVLVLLVTLLFFGSVSDYLGRLPIIITALVFSAAACALFLSAHGAGALYAARALQGIADRDPDWRSALRLSHCKTSPARRHYWVTFGYLHPSGHIMPDHGGDRGAAHLDRGASRSPPYQPCAGIWQVSPCHADHPVRAQCTRSGRRQAVDHIGSARFLRLPFITQRDASCDCNPLTVG